MLTRELIADRALAFIDEHGLDALTLTALGKALHCHGTAIYGHFRDKDELVEAKLGRMYVVAQVAIPSRGSAGQRLLGRMRSLRRAFAEHPNYALRNLTWHEERRTSRPLVGHPELDRTYRNADEVARVDEAAFEVAARALLDACERLEAARSRR